MAFRIPPTPIPTLRCSGHPRVAWHDRHEIWLRDRTGGACTVHIDGVATRSCQVPAGSVGDVKITTIEGLSQDGLSHPVQVAWLQHDVPQCGYCQSGQIMAAAALLKTNPKPSDDDIDSAITNICRCGTYQRIREAIHTAASLGGKA